MPDARTTTPRRTFVARVTGLIAGWPLLGRIRGPLAAIAAQPAQSPGKPNATLLDAVGDAVLPAELGPDGVTRAVAEFQRWMDGYQPGAEANHGYGTGRIERLPPDPRPQWRAQLASLDSDARHTGQSFSALPRERRQALVRAALQNVQNVPNVQAERGDALPNPLLARHVALALLAHFYDSAAATDLCYDARIGRQQCRPLADQRQQPVALARQKR
jgi:gluconate 2-dehydrogenase subunit 3-like protein